mgnify:CR=1 FL=1
MEMKSNGQWLGNISIYRGIFQGDSQSPLLFVITLISLTLILSKCEAGYKDSSNFKLNHLRFMDDLKLYARNKNQLDSLRIFSKDIEMKFGIESKAS